MCSRPLHLGVYYHHYSVGGEGQKGMGYAEGYRDCQIIRGGQVHVCATVSMKLFISYAYSYFAVKRMFYHREDHNHPLIRRIELPKQQMDPLLLSWLE